MVTTLKVRALLTKSKRTPRAKHWRCPNWPGVVIEHLAWAFLLVGLLASSARGQVSLDGVIDFHVHSSPDSTARSIDAIDLAKLAKSRGMRGLVLKNHYESTAALAYVVRKEVPGIEIFGGIVLNRSVGGVNPAAIERMVLVTGGWGKVVWMPTHDNENEVRLREEHRPFVSVSKDGHLLPEVLEVIALCAKYNLVLETGHSSAEDGLLIVREAHQRGVQHIVVTHAMASTVRMTIPQMTEAARDGALIELTYASTLGKNPVVNMRDYAEAIRKVGPENCILASDLGQPGSPLHPDGLVTFFAALRKEGISQSDIDLMSKVNPAHALGLQ